MSRFPNYPQWQYPPGRVVRKRELDGIASMGAWLKGGLRPKTRRVPGVLYGLLQNSTLAAGGDSRDLATAGTNFCDLLFPYLYVGDRICGAGVSVMRNATTATTLCELFRVKMDAPISTAAERTAAKEVLATLQHDGGVTLRELKSFFFEPITVERGYFYRIRVTAGNNGDDVYGGYLDVDHPRQG